MQFAIISPNDSSLNVQLRVIEFIYLCSDFRRNKFANPKTVLGGLKHAVLTLQGLD